MYPTFKIVVLFSLAFLLCNFLSAQNPNVIVKCSETTTDYQLNSKNKVKSISHYEVSKKGKLKKRFQSKVWFDIMGCGMKSLYYTSENIVGGNYTMTISDFNSKGYRTKFEDYKFDKDSVPVLTFSEAVAFDSLFRLKEKNTKEYISKERSKYVTETYKYGLPGFEIMVSQNIRENNAFPYTSNVFKYIFSSSEVPEERENFYYTDPKNYTFNHFEKEKFSEFKTIKDGTIILHQKTIYEKMPNENGSKEIQMDMLTGKKIQETIYHNNYESTTINYDKNGNKINQYNDRLPYGFPSPEKKEIEGVSYTSPVKSDTLIKKNGNKKVIIYEKDYSKGGSYKISQTLEYNSKKLLIKQDLEGLETFTEFVYEYYK